MTNSPDLFNGVITVASVVLFAKFITHRTREGGVAKADPTARWMHYLCVACCGVALCLAFAGLGWRDDALSWLGATSSAVVAAATALLLIDVLKADASKSH
jgi:cytochrome bd-type quinol oxidase subunit 2